MYNIVQLGLTIGLDLIHGISVLLPKKVFFRVFNDFISQ